MKSMNRPMRLLCLMLMAALALGLSGCANGADTGWAAAVEDEPDTVDFQCTSIHYTVAQNVFNRLVEMESDENGDMMILPSLAESWEVSEDGRTYTFHLRNNVTFSNGSPLTASDVGYTFHRLLTHPDSCNRDIADEILGAAALERGETDVLEGFQVLSDLDFSITLTSPSRRFWPACPCPARPYWTRRPPRRRATASARTRRGPSARARSYCGSGRRARGCCSPPTRTAGRARPAAPGSTCASSPIPRRSAGCSTGARSTCWTWTRWATPRSTTSTATSIRIGCSACRASASPISP